MTVVAKRCRLLFSSCETAVHEDSDYWSRCNRRLCGNSTGAGRRRRHIHRTRSKSRGASRPGHSAGQRRWNRRVGAASQSDRQLRGSGGARYRRAGDEGASSRGGDDRCAEAVWSRARSSFPCRTASLTGIFTATAALFAGARIDQRRPDRRDLRQDPLRARHWLRGISGRRIGFARHHQACRGQSISRRRARRHDQRARHPSGALLREGRDAGADLERYPRGNLAEIMG